TGEKPFLVPTGCGSPRVLFEGFARLTPTPSLRLDVVIALDRSGSTGKEALDVDGDGVPESVLEVERAAARSFVAGLDGSITRVALVAFEDSAQVVSEFTADLEDVASRLETVGPPDHGTNYEAAFRLAASPVLESREGGVPGDAHLVEIIHPRAAKMPVAGRKPGRLDNRRIDAEAGAQAQHRPGVLRNIGLEQREGEGRSHSCTIQSVPNSVATAASSTTPEICAMRLRDVGPTIQRRAPKTAAAPNAE
ncbi:MAG: VWA domain-containing protein, partial [Bauldia sp.]